MGSRSIRIKLADPNIEETELAAVNEVLRSGTLVRGERCAELEEALRRLTGRRHAIAVSSGSMSLLAAMKGLGIGPGTTVVVPALTFPAPAFAASFLGAAVRAADVDPSTFNVSASTVAAAIDRDTSLVVAIDQFGLPAPVRDIEKVLAPANIPLLVDAACSMGATYEEEPAGAFGRMAVFSFHPRKVITTGEGGAVLTDDGALARNIRLLVDQGMEGGEFRGIGLNLRLGEINAAIGIAQLSRIENLVAKRRRLAERYRQLPLRFQEASPGAVSAHQTLVAVLPDGYSKDDRAALLTRLAEGGIEAGVASYCLGAVPTIAEALDLDVQMTPNALEIHEKGVALPLHPGLRLADVDEVMNVVHDWLHQR